MKIGVAIVLAALALAGCDSSGGVENAPLANTAEGAPVANTATAAADEKADASARCMFRDTRNWKGSVQGGRLLVTGNVDLQMAGMKPALTPRAGAGGGVAAFDLALAPAAGEPVTDQVRYERPGAPNYRAGEIHCGGERIASFDVISF